MIATHSRDGERRSIDVDRVRQMVWVNAGALALALAVAIREWDSDDWRPIGVIVVILAFAVVSELLAYSPEHEWAVTSSAPYALAIVMTGPAPAVAVALLALTASAIKERSHLDNVLANFANYAVFSVAGALLCSWIVERIVLTPSDPEFGALILGACLYVSVVSQVATIGYDQVIGAPKRDEVAVGGQATADGLAAFVTAAAVLVYGHAGAWALGALVAVQVVYSFLLGQLAQSEQRAKALEQNRAERGRLVDEVSSARERERSHLAFALHDESLQNLYALRQEVGALQDADARARAYAAIDRTIAQLRGEILNLHPTLLQTAGLGDAVRTLATSVSGWGGFRAEVEIDEGVSGPHDQLLFELAREQVINAAKHARPQAVRVSIRRSENAITMAVSDDGCGIAEGRLEEALQQGHVGLATTEERAYAVGGSLAIRTGPSGGTEITTTLPVMTMTA